MIILINKEEEVMNSITSGVELGLDPQRERERDMCCAALRLRSRKTGR